MLKVEDNFIYLTKGDTAYLTVELEDNDEFQVGDSVAFNVKATLKNSIEYVIHKETTIQEKSNILEIKIEPEDTAEMKYGLYFYDVQLTRANGDIFTIITPDENEPKPNFKLLKEVTIDE